VINIPMQIPEQFLSRIANGELIRYGTIIKNASSGNIVGHLKEVGDFSSVVGQLSLNPVTGLLNLGSNITQNIQLNNIAQTLNTLQLASEIGAVASIANLGVSVAGFAVVIKKLKQIERKLDHVVTGIHEIRAILDENNMALHEIVWVGCHKVTPLGSGYRFRSPR